MEPSPSIVERDGLCPQHGAYRSRVLVPGRGIWSMCPSCVSQELEDGKRERKAREELAAAKRHADMLDLARIPERFRGRSFENFVAESASQRHALATCRDFAEGFGEHTRGSGLILAGKPGTGKSHLGAAILQAIASTEIRYATCMDLIRSVRDTWRSDSERTEMQLLRYFERLELLVIDEVGMQYGTDGEQTILFDVLDRRYREVRSTVLLTNQDKTGFKATVGERTFDRLSETCRWVPFDWESYRPTARRAAL